MMDAWYRLVEALLPFEWAGFDFMKNALLATLLVTPCFALLGTMVVGRRMAFFTDVLGHSALTGIAVGILLGFSDPTLPMLGFAVLLAVAVNIFRKITESSMDTVLGVLFAFVVALGIVILSRKGGFARFTAYLIGDVLSIAPAQIAWLLVILACVIAYWVLAGNALVLTGINASLARSRGIRTFLIETSFAVLIALVVTFSIRMVGILIINSLLVLPAAAGRNIARSVRGYTFWSCLISVASGIAGLISSYYMGTAAGATIVLFAAFFYMLTALFGSWWKKRYLT